MKTKEEIERLAQNVHYEFQNQGLDANGCFNQYQGYIKGYAQCQEDMAKSVEDMWVKYRAITNNEDAWSFKEWLVESLNRQRYTKSIY